MQPICLSMWMMGNILDLHKNGVGKRLEGGVDLIMVWDIGRLKEGSDPVASTRTMGRNRHQYTGWSSWVGISGNMEQNPEDHSGTN